MSVRPPGGKGTMIVIFFSGKELGVALLRTTIEPISAAITANTLMKAFSLLIKKPPIL
jgi:hypothetical protein